MDKNLFFYELEGRGYIFQNKKWDEAKHVFEDDMLNMAWEMWSSAKHSVKAQAVPEGFVLLEKKGLRDTYYWDGCEYVVDHPSEYEMELERGEIVTLEKWQRTKETNVYCANIFSDEDNFELVQFDSLEEAEKAVAANKAMIEAQEQSHENG